MNLNAGTDTQAQTCVFLPLCTSSIKIEFMTEAWICVKFGLERQQNQDQTCSTSMNVVYMSIT